MGNHAADRSFIIIVVENIGRVQLTNQLLTQHRHIFRIFL